MKAGNLHDTGARYGKLQKRKEHAEHAAHLLGAVIRGLTAQQGDMVEHVNVEGHHSFGSEATMLLKAGNRGRAVSLLGLFPPVGLAMLGLKDGSKPIVTEATRVEGRIIVKRQTIVPFLYSIVQVRKQARRTLTWVCTLGGGTRVTVECDIEEDRAKMKLEHLDDVGCNQVLFRRQANEWVPDGPRVGLRGTEWSTTKDVPTSLTVWWPYSYIKILTRQAQETRWPSSIEELAEELLEVRREAHG